MLLYCHQVRNIKVSKVYLLCILGILPVGFDNKVAKAVLPSCGCSLWCVISEFSIALWKRKKSYLQQMLTSTEVKLRPWQLRMGAGQLGYDEEQNVNIFVIKADTQLVDTKVSTMSYSILRGCLLAFIWKTIAKSYHNWLICPIAFHFSYYFFNLKLEINDSTSNES